MPRSLRRVAVGGPATQPLLRALADAGLDARGVREATGHFAAVVWLDDGKGEPGRWAAARALLGRRGRVLVVTEAARAVAALPELSRAGLEPKELVLVQGSPNDPPSDAVIVAACAKRGGLVVRSVSGK